MKKLILILMVGLIFTTVSVAQYNSSTPSSELYVDPVTKETALAIEASRSKAKKNFQKFNKEVNAVNWYDIIDGFLASYLTKDGINGKTYFDNKGRFLWSILNYGEKNLPPDVRSQVKSAYFLDFRITHVSEVRHYTEPGSIIYLVQITNNKVWRKLRIQNGEMEVISEFAAL